MAKFRTGNMWDAWDEADLMLVTTNGSIKKDRLVMGGGSAKEAADRFPLIDFKFAEAIRKEGQYDTALGAWKYHLLISPRWFKGEGGKLGAFQTKYAVHRPASMDAIAISTTLLLNMTAYLHGSEQIHMPFPGIGLGGLRREDVLPYVEQLPDTVHIWEYAT